MASLDVEALLVQHFGGYGLRTFGGDLPPRFEESGPLPVVRVIALPATELARPWNGPRLADSAEVDVDVFAANDEETADAAARVQDLTEELAHQGIAVLRAPAFTRRPDWNENVRRRGAVLTIATR
ncbi:hypothetical protein GS876_10335 [Rhodococcus hoagii]|nr:hypothetical protein [Prescottella equi]NKT31582.1 hypothetical protein [Prescottella equi]NKT39266.1 hypothetical protein [Prescottella equi]NKT72942.1 hypothetical protein [Prescottella equi]NKT75894.1 hypothetical protein [Prescottella equi]